jgi:hypothetical protein
MDTVLAQEFILWMKTVHIPEVMESGCFKEYKILKVLTNASDDEGVNISIQYSAESLSDYENYRDNYAPALQQKTRDRYGDRILAFRTLLEVIE